MKKTKSMLAILAMLLVFGFTACDNGTASDLDLGIIIDDGSTHFAFANTTWEGDTATISFTSDSEWVGFMNPFLTGTFEVDGDVANLTVTHRNGSPVNGNGTVTVQRVGDIVVVVIIITIGDEEFKGEAGGGGGADGGGTFIHESTLFASRFFNLDGNDGWVLEVIFSRPFDGLRNCTITLQGLRVDNWHMVGGERYLERYLDTDNLFSFPIYEVDDLSGYHFWVDIPLCTVSPIRYGPRWRISLHESVNAVPEPRIGWAGFRVTINNDVEGHNITHALGSRVVTYADGSQERWDNEFFGQGRANSGIRGNWVGVCGHPFLVWD